MTVRAPGPPALANHSGTPTPRTYRLLYNPYAGRYRLHACLSGEVAPTEANYIEIEHYTSKAELETALRHWPSLLRFAVFESPVTAEVHLAAFGDLPDDWTDHPRFPCFTLFNDETDAKAYAEKRRVTLSQEQNEREL